MPPPLGEDTLGETWPHCPTLTILPFAEWREVGVPAMVEAEGQLGLQGELLQLIGNSFTLRAGGR